jgi:hypothetical protein
MTLEIVHEPADEHRRAFVQEWPEVELAHTTRPERWISRDGNAFAIVSHIDTGTRLAAEWWWYLRTADGTRDRVPLRRTLRVGLAEYHVVPDAPAEGPGAEWSRLSRLSWLRGEAALPPAELFERTFAALARHLEIERQPEATFATLTCWLLTTFLYHGLEACGYLHVHGPAGSGKSRLLQLLNQLCYRPTLSSNLTAAATFRTLDGYGGTLILDEAERLAQSTPDVQELRSVLLAGYKRGSRATRLEAHGKAFRTASFDVYGPKVLGCIAGLPSALASRCIRIQMMRARHGSAVTRRRLDEDQTRFRDLKDAIYIFMLEHSSALVNHISNTTHSLPEMSGRDVELWAPILATASWFETHGADGLRELVEGFALANVKESEDDKTPDADGMLIAALAANVRRGQSVGPGQILEQVKSAEPNLFRTWTAKGVGARLKNYGFLCVKSHGRREYRPSLDEVTKVAGRYGIDIEPDGEASDGFC